MRTQIRLNCKRLIHLQAPICPIPANCQPPPPQQLRDEPASPCAPSLRVALRLRRKVRFFLLLRRPCLCRSATRRPERATTSESQRVFGSATIPVASVGVPPAESSVQNPLTFGWVVMRIAIDSGTVRGRHFSVCGQGGNSPRVQGVQGSKGSNHTFAQQNRQDLAQLGKSMV